MDGNKNWNDVQNLYNDSRNSGKTHDESVKIVQSKYAGIGPENQQRLQKGYKPAQTPAPSTVVVPGKIDKMINRDQVIVSYTDPSNKLVKKTLDKKAHGFNTNNKVSVTLKNTPPYDLVSVVKVDATPGPVPKPPGPSNTNDDVISTLDLKLLTKGGGDWNVSKVNLKKSKIVSFQGRDAVEAVYSKNSGTSKDPGVGGFQFVAAPKGLNNQEITFSWDVWYPKGFDFAKGGKHGGPFIGEGVASGYRHSPTGSSNRIMWQRDGGVIDYIYPPSDLKQKIPGLDPEGHGIGFFKQEFAKALKYDTWNAVEIGTKMNSFKNGVPQLDGESYVVVNGKKAVLKGINWSRSPDLFINRLDWNNFFGGPDPSPKDQKAYFSNFQMKKYSA